MSIFTELGIRDGNDRFKEEILYNVAACYTLAEKKIGRVLAAFDLSPVKMNVLLLIKHAGKEAGLSQVDIGNRMIVTAGNITRLVDRLEKENLVERTPQAGDRRVRVIRITPKGSELLDKAWPSYQEAVEQLVPAVPDPEIKKLNDFLSGFRRRMSGSQAETQ